MPQMEQMPLDFNAPMENNPPAETPPSSAESKKFSLAELQGKSTAELQALYQATVEKDPRYRFLEDKELITGILDPSAELDRLAEIDFASNAAEKKHHWSN